MRIGPATVLCISVSARPGITGTAMHAAGYEALGLDFAYKPFAVTDIAGAIAGVRALGIRGCSVSMPFKETVIPLLDGLDPRAKAVGAVNTVVNDGGTLTGYNTDVDGARTALAELGAEPGTSVLVLGAGGAAKATVYALGELGVNDVVVAGRSNARGPDIERLGARFVDWSEREKLEANILVNATPIGMTPDDASCPMEGLRPFGSVMDVIVSPPETVLIRHARAAGVPVAPGTKMVLHQAASQFRLYTGHVAPLDALHAALADALGTA